MDIKYQPHITDTATVIDYRLSVALERKAAPTGSTLPFVSTAGY